MVVIGGGPAGSTTSTLIAQQGYKVELFERERFPRFHIGESLIPETYWVLKRLGMLPKMQQSHFVKKHSVQFVNANGKLSAPFYFWDNKPHECSQTWQVVRSEFDKMMLDNAREHGVERPRGRARARRAVRGRPRPRRPGEGRGRRRSARCAPRSWSTRAGRSALMQNRLQASGLGSRAQQGRHLDVLGGGLPRHRPRRGRDDRASRPPSRNGWFWYIPLHDNVVSVGVVAPFDYLFKGRGTVREQTYERGGRAPARP